MILLKLPHFWTAVSVQIFSCIARETKRCYHAISLKAFSSSLEQHFACKHTHGHPQSLRTDVHLLTRLQKAFVGFHHCLFFCVLCLYVIYMLMNLEGRHELCASARAWEKETGIRTDGGGEPWRRVGFLFKVKSPRLTALSSLVFPPYSDKSLLFCTHVCLNPSILALNILFCSWLNCQVATVCVDWQPRARVRATRCSSSALPEIQSSSRRRCSVSVWILLLLQC